MPIRHVVVAGESVLGLAEKYGLFLETVRDDPANRQLKETRSDLNILMAGDVVVIPDRRERIEERPTGATYRFRRKGIPALLRLRLEVYGEPGADLGYTLTVDGQEQSGTTDADGVLEAYVPAQAEEGTLILGEDQAVLELRFGHLDPLAEISGVQERLQNLDYPCDDPTGELGSSTSAALRDFQEDAGLEPTGQADSITREKLRKAHDLFTSRTKGS